MPPVKGTREFSKEKEMSNYPKPLRNTVSLMMLMVLALRASCGNALAKEVHHYVFFGREREQIQEAAFLRTKALEGAQLKYTWRELEPTKDAYDFNAIRSDLTFLKAHGKRLFVQLQDASFVPN